MQSYSPTKRSFKMQTSIKDLPSSRKTIFVTGMLHRQRCLAFETLDARRMLSAVSIPVDLTAEPSGQVVVPVEIDDAEYVRAVEIEINYDTELLDADNSCVTAGSIWSGTSAEVVANVDDSAGNIVVWVFAAEGLDAVSGNLIEIEFTASSDAIEGESTTIDLADVEINENAITLETQPQPDIDSTDGLITFVGTGNETVTPVDLGQVDCKRLESLDPSAGELWYSLETAHEGWLTVQAVEGWTANELTFQLVEPEAITVPIATSTLQEETLRFDYSVEQGQTYLLHVTGTASDASLLLANLVHQTGTSVTVYGTGDADVFVFSAATARDITINGVAYHYEEAEISTIEFTGGEGRDVAWLYDSTGNESLEAWPDRATLTNATGDAERNFVVEVAGIEDLLAYATRGGTDSAVCHGSEGGDKLKSYEESARLRAKDSSYTVRAKSFDTIVADAGSGGSDLAVFNGSDGDDTFTYLGADLTGRLEGEDRNHAAVGFASLVVRAGDGESDVAHFTDIPETNDVLYLKSQKSQLVSEGLKVTARAFDRVYATASETGFDIARIYDTSGDDHLEVEGNTARLYRNSDGELKLLYETVAFERVKAYSTEGADTTAIGDHEIDLVLNGWDG